ncbi:GNAT family N-acetyltransferase [Halonotius terrestris]|uniref:GNAT family N-acetyltransferase n=1 Tax=Halonotius terrestris TaxID=2487750 RepID=A0A8J8PAH6_9EURY|nr:GNAT family N-acetyltransferase [Halonotius terrestris]TQQ79296.1 GNAT family N-acetyltransferase [Halonotius terrestris]
MYVRDAKNRDEAWLLAEIESIGLDDEAFRSRDYVLAVDEQSDERVGFGRLRIHAGDPDVCELTGIGVLESWRGQGVGAHVVERLIAEAGDEGFETVYVLTDQPGYLDQFGFEERDRAELPAALAGRLERKDDRLAGEVVARVIATDGFEMPPRLREAFKHAEADNGGDEEPPETAADFGIDADSATYKYDTGS